MNDRETEQLIKDKGADVAPRVTKADIENAIVEEHVFVVGDAIEAIDSLRLRPHQSLHLLTICVLVLRNGFTVTGESACASPENYDAEIGAKFARESAVKKVWPLLGYALREKLSQG